MSLADALMQERRARIAAERLLELRQQELFEANEKLSRHALTLSEQIIEKREEVEDARHDLERAHEAADIAQRRLWESVETIQDGFAVFDADERLVAANKAYLSVFDGLECVRPGVSYAEIVDVMIEEGIIDPAPLLPDEWRQTMLERWRHTPISDTTIRLWSGHHIRLVDRRSSSGDTVSLALNITNTIRYQEKLKKARTQAEAASRAKSSFLARMSHELRTPMNGVLGMAELLADTTLDEDQRLYVETIRSSSTALLELINDVLDFSKLEAKKLEIRAEPFDPENLLFDLFALFFPAIETAGIDLLLDYDMFIPPLLVGDAGRLRQILTNLIGNAVKFTTEGHVLVRVVGIPCEGARAVQLHVNVEDTGIGIPPEKLDHIFGEFNQVEDEKNRRFEGTGLGLAIARQLVELMGGEIWVDSSVGVGSSFGFRITLPVAEGQEAAPIRLPEGQTRIVILRSTEPSDSIVARQMQALGASVELLDEIPLEGGDILQRADVIVMEWRMADDFTAELISSLREKGFDGPLVVTYRDQRPEIASGLAGIHTLKRPISRRKLAELVSHLPETVPALRPADSAPDPEPSARQVKILAAEDNKTNRLVFSKMLKNLNIQLRFAENGAEAVAMWQQWRPDLVFMDISMPEMDGKEATRRIRQLEIAEGQCRRTQVVAMTAHAMDGDRDDIMKAGLDDYLTKPLAKAAIIKAIQQAAPKDAAPICEDAEYDALSSSAAAE